MEKTKKKIFIVVLSIIAAVAVIIVFKVLKSDPELDFNVVNKDKNEFTFSAPKVKEAPIEASPAREKKTIYLYLDEGLYYPVSVPESLAIVTDYNKYIYAQDSTFSVSVASNISHDMLSTQVGIKNAMVLAPSLVRTEIGYKGAQEAAKHVVNDKAIVIRAYNNPEAFATAMWSLEEKTYVKMDSKKLLIDEKGVEEDGNGKTEVLSSVPVKTGYHSSIVVGMEDTYNQAYMYTDGSLTMAKEFKQFQEAIRVLENRAILVTGKEKADAIYQSSSLYYAEVGNCTIGIVSVNFNTSITLFGVGEEARFNIATYMQSY